MIHGSFFTCLVFFLHFKKLLISLLKRQISETWQRYIFDQSQHMSGKISKQINAIQYFTPVTTRYAGITLLLL